MEQKKTDGKNAITPKALLRFGHLFTPVSIETSPGVFKVDAEGNRVREYSACLCFEPGTDLKALERAAAAAAFEKWGDKARAMWNSGAIRKPFRLDGEEKGWGEGVVFVNAKSRYQPKVVDERLQPVLSEDDVYDGCFVRASVRAFAYDTSGNKGVSFSLGNVQRMAIGERISGRPNPEDEFEKVANDDDPSDGFGPAAPAAAAPAPVEGEDPFADQ